MLRNVRKKSISSSPLCWLLLLSLAGLSLSQALDEIDGRVVGGAAAPMNSAPYIVSMQYRGTHYCAASILNSKWLVTAAHCLTNKAQVCGTTLVACSNAVAGTASTTQKRSIAHFKIHDLYTGGPAPYDIGLIYTETAFTWSSAVAAVKLPSSGSKPKGTANLYGWGSTSTGKTPSYPSVLQVAANLPILEHSVCDKALTQKGANLHDTNICTGCLAKIALFE
ncbi:trypsin delta [Drosophila busckii]|uniref:trypsin delta n=1 Tax=Drosophila busckii TaxID=30019 RepID=UPI001433070A|nr:trypsin delta [Drosophila busckii]